MHEFPTNTYKCSCASSNALQSISSRLSEEDVAKIKQFSQEADAFLGEDMTAPSPQLVEVDLMGLITGTTTEVS